MNQAIHTSNAPAAIGPYSQAVRAGSLIFVSGQIPVDPKTGAFAGDKKDNGAGGLGAKMTPAAVLRISKDGSTQLINLKSQDAVSKILDMAPGIVSRFTNRGKENDISAEDIADAFTES